MKRLRFGFLSFFTILSLAMAGDFNAQDPNTQRLDGLRLDGLHELTAKLDAQEAEIRTLRQQVLQQQTLWDPRPESGLSSCGHNFVQRMPLVMEESAGSVCDNETESKSVRRLNFYADYDRGFVIRPFDPKKHPFELNVGGWIQFRHHGFASDVDSWTDNAGVTRVVRNRNALDVERARLVLSGFAVDRRLTYFLQLDGDTDGEHTVDFFDYWWAWQLTGDFQIQLGKRKVPGSRQWLLGARETRFADRPMANDFFRPDRTVGIFGIGKLSEHNHYQLMIGNGYQSANIPNSLSDNRMTFAATQYIDPLGDFGLQLVDFESSAAPLARLGHSFAYSPQSGDALREPFEESEFARLADGTQLTQTGALAPGVTVSGFDLYFYGLDAALKHRGWSFNAEVFLRWIEKLQASGPLPVSDLYQHGFYTEGGYFLIPKKFDANVRYSQVSGKFGNASEFATGVNWYPLSKTALKLTFDVTVLDGSPLQNPTSDILVGDDGVLFRSQVQATF